MMHADRSSPTTQCPACDDEHGLRPFYAVTGIPTQSNLLMKMREAARAHPRGDLSLAACGACGFVTNIAFDPATQELSGNYEATQGHSPTFGAFARKLAQRWADRYQLAGKRVLEIGCGQGEFIALLCETAGAQGIGIDPILSPDRQPASNVRFISDRYDERYADLAVDFICCRHTLEHVHEPLAFLKTIRHAIGDRPDVVLAFEVPDTLRVLRECAFWDIYYEHCSYFTAESLRTCFERAGFEVLDLYREFDDQYLIVDARPALASSAGESFNLDAEIARFAERCPAYLKEWQDRFAQWRQEAARVVLWGSGSKAVGFLSTLGLNDGELPFVVDINPNKQGTFLPGTAQEIIAPNGLLQYKPDVVIVMNPVYVDEIKAALDGMRLHPEIVPLAD
jgi:SAM-dependent methyltransferase